MEQQAAATTLMTVVFTFVQNWLEDNVEAVPAPLKAPASPGLENAPSGKTP
jgi:hypothetical protein